MRLYYRGTGTIKVNNANGEQASKRDFNHTSPKTTTIRKEELFLITANQNQVQLYRESDVFSASK